MLLLVFVFILTNLHYVIGLSGYDTLTRWWTASFLLIRLSYQDGTKELGIIYGTGDDMLGLVSEDVRNDTL